MRAAVLGGCILLGAVSAQAAAFVDDFDGSALDARWTASTSGTYGVAGGVLTAQMSNTTYSNPLAWNLFTTDAPVGDFVATMKCSVAGTAGWLPQVGIGLFSADHQSLMFTAEEEDFYGWGEFSGGAKFGTVTAQGTVTGTAFPFTLTRRDDGKDQQQRALLPPTQPHRQRLHSRQQPEWDDVRHRLVWRLQWFCTR